MKKIILALMIVMTFTTAAWSQNANRTGFFLEAALGGIVGKTPQVAFSVENNILKAHTLTGTAISIAPGYRLRITKGFAYEGALEFQAPLSAIKSQPTVKILPVGFRYTSQELYRNLSLYATLRLGGVLASDACGALADITTPNMPKQDISIHNGTTITGGVAASIGVGVNINNHLYGGLTYDPQLIFSQYRGYDNKCCLWGMLGIRVGYRF